MDSFKRFFKRWWGSKSAPFIVILLMAIALMSKQLLTHSVLLGADSIFHFNRFYDAAMQMKTGKFNYFQANFGFDQTGRVVNAIYGPIIAYLSGVLLIICRNWYMFQSVQAIIFLVIAGMTMYLLCIKNNVSRGYAMVIGILYMYSSQLMGWITTQQFAGVGAMLVPLLVLTGTEAINRKKVSIPYLALAMTLLIQTHIMSTIIGFIAVIPVFLVALLHTNHKFKMVLHTLIAAVITLALTANVWGSALELFGNNYLMPVFPVTNMEDYAFRFDHYSWYSLVKPVEMVVFLFVIYYFVRHFKHSDIVTRTLTITGTFFLLASTTLFPWLTLQKLFPILSSNLQFPKRFLVIPFVMLLLVFGKILTYDNHIFTLYAFDNPKLFRYALLFTLIGINMGINGYNMDFKVDKSNQMVAENYPWAPIAHSYMYVKYNHHTIKQDFFGDNWQYLISDINKATPDYLPVKANLKPDDYNKLHPYYTAHYQLIIPNLNHDFDKHVNKDGSLTVVWKNKSFSSKNIQVPAVKYANTQVILNGKKNASVKTTEIGAIIAKSKVGQNVMTIKYVNNQQFNLLMIVFVISWLLMIIYLGAKLMFKF
ncbi:hypothetical protein DY124_05065 [Apilactobacillus micheneri]|uniref:hypothetical protein n=1 Tax=Apilactobacillus micheneri TaxID=1899430 RepID=UPI00112BBB26|nr:hypothetical protein [Apilactobacillus micheneri]TPR43673.1 hypothetical protein DY124_05065 [Apilactobacillus micheneri]TPR47601.1 hypothetical protein DY125_05065 [Apilactobacillus micheneri]